VRFSTFFSNLKLKNQKWTFINVQFQKSQNTFEKTLHHSFFGVRMRHFRDLTFMLLCFILCLRALTALCSGLYIRKKIAERWSKSWKAILGKFLSGCFWGCEKREKREK
jgi:Ni,Fe-hydrogenase I cytochrome b subunit